MLLLGIEEGSILVLRSYVDPSAHHIVSSKDQYEFVPSQLAAPEGLGAVPAQQSLFAVNFVLRFPSGQTLALPAVHRLLTELLPDEEVDLGGPDGGGGLDVEVLSVLPDVHVRLGRRCHCHLPQHSIHTQSLEQLVKILAALHLPSAGEIGHVSRSIPRSWCVSAAVFLLHTVCVWSFM